MTTHSPAFKAIAKQVESLVLLDEPVSDTLMRELIAAGRTDRPLAMAVSAKSKAKKKAKPKPGETRSSFSPVALLKGVVK